MTRSVHDLGRASSRDIHRLVTRLGPRRLVAVRARRGGARGRRAGPDPDPGAVPGLRGQLPRGQRGRPRDRRRHHRRLARADLDRGDPQHDHDGRRDDRGGGRRDRPRRVAARAARRGRGEGPGPARRRRSVAAGRRTRVARPAVRLGHWVPEQIRRAGGWELLGADGEPSRPDDLGRRLRGRPRDAPADAVRLPPARDGRRVGAHAPAAWLRRPDRRPPRPGLRGRRVGLLQPARPAGHRRHRAAGRDLRPGRVRRHRAARVAGPRSTPRPGRCRSARPSTACGAARRTPAAARTTSRAGRSSARTASARPATTASCASGCDQALDRARRGRQGRGRRRDRRREPSRRRPPPDPDLDAEMLAYYEARAPEYDDWYLRRGRYAHGPIHDAAWNAELDVAGRWLDGLPIRGEIVELAAGTGWWSPLLASKGELSLYDGDRGAPRARPRAARRARPARAPPRPRRLGRAGPPGRRRRSPASG